jgi:hypothetical protein
MTKRLAILLLAFAITVPLSADFASIARTLDAQRGVNRIWIPFLGIARVAVRIIEPEGVHDFQLATFEGTDDVDPKMLRDLMRTQAGPGFRPLVQTWSRRSNDWSFIYARPSAKSDRLELMVLAHDGSDTVLVRVEVDANVVAKEIRHHPRNVSRVARR